MKKISLLPLLFSLSLSVAWGARMNNDNEKYNISNNNITDSSNSNDAGILSPQKEIDLLNRKLETVLQIFAKSNNNKEQLNNDKENLTNRINNPKNEINNLNNKIIVLTNENNRLTYVYNLCFVELFIIIGLLFHETYIWFLKNPEKDEKNRSYR